MVQLGLGLLALHGLTISEKWRPSHVTIALLVFTTMSSCHQEILSHRSVYILGNMNSVDLNQTILPGYLESWPLSHSIWWLTNESRMCHEFERLRYYDLCAIYLHNSYFKVANLELLEF